MDTFNTEAMKLSLQGVTILTSTGDDGVANFGCNCDSTQSVSISNCACLLDSSSSINESPWSGLGTWSGRGYFPTFPATCPYVTAVGATMGVENVVPNINEPERSCQVCIKI